MKQPLPKYKVLRNMTTEQIIGYGYDKWIQKHKWLILILGIVDMVAATFTISLADKYTGNAKGLVAIIGLAILISWVLWWYYSARKYGKKLWNSLKDKEQPFEID